MIALAAALLFATPRSIPVIAQPVALDPGDPARDRLGALRWLGGVVLTSPDRRFGGLSGLRWHGGRLIAVSDDGQAFDLRPVEVRGRLTGVADARIVDLVGPDGAPLPAAKNRRDFEALEVGVDTITLAMETDAALWTYRVRDGLPAGTPIVGTDAADWRARQAGNGGLEAVAIAPGLRLMVSETVRDSRGGAAAHLTVDGEAQEVSVPVSDGFAPSDLVLLDAAARRFLMLGRYYDPVQGMAMRLIAFRVARGADGRWAARDQTTLATLRPPLTVDNMEGLAVRHEGARTTLYMISDDNMSPRQRTILMKWAL